MKNYSLKDMQQEVLFLQCLLENEKDEDKQFDLEQQIERLQAEIETRIKKESENEK